MTHAQINATFAQLEKQRTDLLEKLARYDDKVLNQKPRHEAWSAIEVLHHLIVAEQSSFKYLIKKTQDINAAQKVGMKEAMRLALLKIVLNSPFKFKVPDTALPAVKYATLAETKTLWDGARKDIQSVWMALPDDVLDGNWFKHPLAGKMSLMQMMQFMQTHIGRHEQQIWRTLKEVSK